jgi:anti-anti-sigma factor
MGIRNWSQDTLLVDLPGESGLEEELREAVRLIHGHVACDVIIDFSHVTILNSSCLAVLLRLRNHLQENGGRLVLCNIGMATGSILAVTGLTGVFEITGDTRDALAVLHSQTRSAAAPKTG